MRGNAFFSSSILRKNETIHKVYKQLNCVICKKKKIVGKIIKFISSIDKNVKYSFYYSYKRLVV